MTRLSDGHAVEPALVELVRDYDKQWSGLDFVGVSELWVRDAPQPIYVGDEYAAPLIGADELDRHWARIAGRLKAVSVSSTLHEFDVVDDTVVRALLLSRWRLTEQGGRCRAHRSQLDHLVPGPARRAVPDLSSDGVPGVCSDTKGSKGLAARRSTSIGTTGSRARGHG